jgi:hypothetical protein
MQRVIIHGDITPFFGNARNEQQSTFMVYTPFSSSNEILDICSAPLYFYRLRLRATLITASWMATDYQRVGKLQCHGAVIDGATS